MQQAGGTLFIVGNGFDLQCGLKSSYTDFFKWLKQDKARASDNLWAVHLLNNCPTGQLWVNVEDCLQKALKAKVKNVPLLNHWASMAVKFYKDVEKGGAACPESKEAVYIIEYIKDKGKASFTFNAHWFLNELRAFERQFCEYLQAEVSENQSYFDNVAKLMDMISDKQKMNVLNFNYTNPFAFNFDNPQNNKSSDMVAQNANVHGTYEKDNIIFGVDYTEELPTDAHIFTKTHRKMMQGSPARALYWYATTIKFYGHSLGKADYSYFQSIFDNYNLYGGDLSFGQYKKEQVVLEFYYTIFDESKETEIVRDAMDSVYKLITAYGKTIDNKDKGKNLLHKLLLEGRVQVKFLPNIKSCSKENL